MLSHENMGGGTHTQSRRVTCTKKHTHPCKAHTNALTGEEDGRVAVAADELDDHARVKMALAQALDTAPHRVLVALQPIEAVVVVVVVLAAAAFARRIVEVEAHCLRFSQRPVTQWKRCNGLPLLVATTVTAATTVAAAYRFLACHVAVQADLGTYTGGQF